MERFVVIGTSPTHDTSVVTGPHSHWGAAHQASLTLISKGWVTEICPLTKVKDAPLQDWSSPEHESS